MSTEATLGQKIIRTDFSPEGDTISKIKQAYAKNIDHILSFTETMQENEAKYPETMRLATKLVDQLEVAAMIHVKLLTV